ncbi:hypothetical protein V7124_19685 [Neobacillus niacini]|uniref:hypothetical protein n=1 Tax=Neobacillus niacini TaxID=86668 RepID=UPI002FFEA0EC
MAILFDITTFNETMKTLKRMFGIDDEFILEFIKRENNTVHDFLNYISADKESISELDIIVTSTHVTTNDDECKSLKEIGLVNTIEAISLNTPFKRHLDKHGILINLQNGTVEHRGSTYFFGKSFNGYSDTEEENLLEHIAFKLYCDRQVNGFFCTENALTYGGRVNKRPELMNNIANLLNYNELVEDWVKNNNLKCYVIKFAIPLSEYSVDSFGNIPSNLDNQVEIDLLKKIWMIHLALTNIKDHVFYQGLVRERISYLNPDSKVKPLQFIDIFSESEYLRYLK